MGYEVSTTNVIGLQFGVNELSDHPDINWEDGLIEEPTEEEVEDMMEFELEELKVGRLITYAKSIGLEVLSTRDGESSTTDFIYVGLSLSGKPSDIRNKIDLVEKILTPDVIQKCVDIMESEPIVLKGFEAEDCRDINLHVAYDKSW